MKYLIILLTYISISIASEGKIGGVTYFDYTNSKEKSAFNFNRQYFSYGVNVSDDVSFKVVFDVGRTNKGDFVYINNDGEPDKMSEDTRLIVFLKKAQIDYSTSYGKISMGLIGMNTYNIQEKNWGYRFIEKSAIDKYGFSSTADLGLGFSKSLTDQLKMSLQVVNGEGYKNPQSDKYHKIAFNSTYGEHNLVKNSGFNAGVVYTTEQTDNKQNIMTSFFGGFAGMGLRLGGQYNMLTENTKESKVVSVSSNYGLKENINVFTRYDMWDDNDEDKKNGKNNLITGIVLTCGSGLSMAPNMRMTSFEDNSDSVTEYRINFQFKF
jgi:hypothetical protein